MFRGAPSRFGRRQQPLDSFALFVTQVAGIAVSLHDVAIARPGHMSTFQTRSETYSEMRSWVQMRVALRLAQSDRKKGCMGPALSRCRGATGAKSVPLPERGRPPTSASAGEGPAASSGASSALLSGLPDPLPALSPSAADGRGFRKRIDVNTLKGVVHGPVVTRTDQGDTALRRRLIAPSPNSPISPASVSSAHSDDVGTGAAPSHQPGMPNPLEGHPRV